MYSGGSVSFFPSLVSVWLKLPNSTTLLSVEQAAAAVAGFEPCLSCLTSEVTSATPKSRPGESASAHSGAREYWRVCFPWLLSSASSSMGTGLVTGTSDEGARLVREEGRM